MKSKKILSILMALSLTTCMVNPSIIFAAEENNISVTKETEVKQAKELFIKELFVANSDKEGINITKENIPNLPQQALSKKLPSNVPVCEFLKDYNLEEILAGSNFTSSDVIKTEIRIREWVYQFGQVDVTVDASSKLTIEEIFAQQGCGMDNVNGAYVDVIVTLPHQKVVQNEKIRTTVFFTDDKGFTYVNRYEVLPNMWEIFFGNEDILPKYFLNIDQKVSEFFEQVPLDDMFKDSKYYTKDDIVSYNLILGDTKLENININKTLKQIVEENNVDQFTRMEIQPVIKHKHLRFFDGEPELKVVEPTCTTEGYTVELCACGAELPETKKDIIPALGHKFGEWTVVKEATEKEEGLKERVCLTCGEKETEVIPMLKPVEPENPDKPVEPENPDKPVEPENPDVPVEPENPDVPVEPENPDVPVEPENPDVPVEPENPDVPVEPENPDKPVEPETTEKPVQPETKVEQQELVKVEETVVKEEPVVEEELVVEDKPVEEKVDENLVDQEEEKTNKGLIAIATTAVVAALAALEISFYKKRK